MKPNRKKSLIGLCIFTGLLTNIFAGESKTTDPARFIPRFMEYSSTLFQQGFRFN